MAVGHQSCLYSKLPIHIDFKYHVHIYVLIYRPNFNLPHTIECNVVNFLKYNTGVCYLFFNCISPEFIHQFPVDIICLFYCLGYPYNKRMLCAPIIGFCLGTNRNSTVKILLNPPAEVRFIPYFIIHGIFIQFN